MIKTFLLSLLLTASVSAFADTTHAQTENTCVLMISKGAKPDMSPRFDIQCGDKQIAGHSIRPFSEIENKTVFTAELKNLVVQIMNPTTPIQCEDFENDLIFYSICKR